MASVTQKRRSSVGQQSAPSRPGPTNTGYSPEALEAQSSFVRSGRSASAIAEGSARLTMSRSREGITASASSS